MTSVCHPLHTSMYLMCIFSNSSVSAGYLFTLCWHWKRVKCPLTYHGIASVSWQRCLKISAKAALQSLETTLLPQITCQIFASKARELRYVCLDSYLSSGRIILSYNVPGAGTFVWASPRTARSQIYSAEQQQHLRAEISSLSVLKPTWRHCTICNGGLDRSTCTAHGQPASEPGAETSVTANSALRVRDIKRGRREVGNLVLFIEVICCLKPWLTGSSPWRQIRL